jgi:UDP-3-O-[3-hydroxymyristoyl] glucosamine N-acyltransferase
MNAYMIVSNRTIEPFGDHPGDCLIVNKPLSTHQKVALTSERLLLVPVSDPAGIEDTDEHLVFSDYLYFTYELLHEFIERSRPLRCRTRAAMKPGTSTLRCMAATQNVEVHEDYIAYSLFYVPAEGYRDREAQVVVIDADQAFESVPMPAHLVEAGEYHVPLTDKLLVQVEHWTNLYAANVATLLADVARVMSRPKLSLLLMAMKARSFNKWSVLKQANQIGRGCDIHPTAYIEGSTIGDNVKIGAMAVVRESVVGDHCYIANNAAVELSVIGDTSELQGGAVVQYSVLYPGAFTFAKGINASLLGRDTFVGDGATLADVRFDGRSVTVMKDGQKVDTGNTYLGACLGHGVYLGSGCVVAPGRTIPNGMHISPDESRIITRCDTTQDIRGHRRTDFQSRTHDRSEK